MYVDNDLTGNALAPTSLLARDRSAVYTFPDETKNRMHLGHLRGSQRITDDLLVSANGFFRDYQRHTFNGDAEVICVDDATGQEAFDAGGQPVPPGRCSGSSAGFFDGAGNPLAGTLVRQAGAENRTTSTHTHDWGTTLQLSHRGKIFGRGNQVTAGVAYDGHDSRFTQREADADLVPGA